MPDQSVVLHFFQPTVRKVVRTSDKISHILRTCDLNLTYRIEKRLFRVPLPKATILVPLVTHYEKLKTAQIINTRECPPFNFGLKG